MDAHSQLQPKHQVATGGLYGLRKSNLMLGKFEEDSEIPGDLRDTDYCDPLRAGALRPCQESPHGNE